MATKLQTAKEELKKIIKNYEVKTEILERRNFNLNRKNIELSAKIAIANQTIADQKSMLMNGLGS